MTKVNIPDFEKIGKEILNDAISYSSVTGLNFFKSSFDNQGFTDTSFEPWQKRKNDTRQGASILIQSSNLRDSLRILSKNKTQIIFGTNIPYASIHNNGGIIKITITKKSRKFFWFMWYKTEKPMWKALALTKKSEVLVKMPKRQFIGQSKALMDDLDNWIKKQIVERFKNS